MQEAPTTANTHHALVAEGIEDAFEDGRTTYTHYDADDRICASYDLDENPGGYSITFVVEDCDLLIPIAPNVNKVTVVASGSIDPDTFAITFDEVPVR